MGNLFDEIPDEHREEAQKWAKLAVTSNPKLVKVYFEGHTAVSDLTEYAVKHGAQIDERWIAEYVVFELDEIRRERLDIKDEQFGLKKMNRKGTIL